MPRRSTWQIMPDQRLAGRCAFCGLLLAFTEYTALAKLKILKDSLQPCFLFTSRIACYISTCDLFIVNRL